MTFNELEKAVLENNQSLLFVIDYICELYLQRNKNKYPIAQAVQFALLEIDRAEYQLLVEMVKNRNFAIKKETNNE